MFMFQHLVESVPRREEAVRELHMVLRLTVQQANMGVVFGYLHTSFGHMVYSLSIWVVWHSELRIPFKFQFSS